MTVTRTAQTGNLPKRSENRNTLSRTGPAKLWIQRRNRSSINPPHAAGGVWRGGLILCLVSSSHPLPRRAGLAALFLRVAHALGEGDDLVGPELERLGERRTVHH